MAIALVTDFDGTAVTRDLGDDIVTRFVANGSTVLQELNERVRAGALTLVGLQRAIWPQVRCTAADLSAWVEERAELRAGFEQTVRDHVGAGERLVVASGGFGFYIRPVLGRLGILAEDLSLLCNEGQVADGRIEVAFPHAERLGCPRCAVCKGKVLDELREQGCHTVYCGDGISDGCAIRRADALFCVEGSTLHRNARREGAPHTPFNTFDEVRAALGLT